MSAVNPSQRLKGRVAIVTGSSQGIGREICEQFHSEGAVLVCADLRPGGNLVDGTPAETTTHERISQLGGKAIFVQTDVTSAASMEAVVAKAVEEYGRLDM
jgi:NAD(P)-dependent dehydrogenase (short-subunit alcohol dehydrogenase family)